MNLNQLNYKIVLFALKAKTEKVKLHKRGLRVEMYLIMYTMDTAC